MPRRNTVVGLCRAVHQATEGEAGAGELQVWRTYGDQQPLNKSMSLFKAGVQDGDCLTMAYVAHAIGAEESAAAAAPRPRAPAAVMVRVMTEVPAFKYGELGTCAAPQVTPEQLSESWQRETDGHKRRLERPTGASAGVQHRRRCPGSAGEGKESASAHAAGAAGGSATPAVVGVGDAGACEARRGGAITPRSGGLDAAVAAWEEAESEGEGKESELAEEMPSPAV
jgi:hypothetical protein